MNTAEAREAEWFTAYDVDGTLASLYDRHGIAAMPSYVPAHDQLAEAAFCYANHQRVRLPDDPVSRLLEDRCGPATDENGRRLFLQMRRLAYNICNKNVLGPTTPHQSAACADSMADALVLSQKGVALRPTDDVDAITSACRMTLDGKNREHVFLRRSIQERRLVMRASTMGARSGLRVALGGMAPARLRPSRRRPDVPGGGVDSGIHPTAAMCIAQRTVLTP